MFSTLNHLRNCAILLSNWNIYFALVVLLFSFSVNVQLLTSAYLKVKRLFAFIPEIIFFFLHIGACCPLCAGMLRILYDKDKLDTFARVNSLIMPYGKWYTEKSSHCILSPEKLTHYKTDYFQFVVCFGFFSWYCLYFPLFLNIRCRNWITMQSKTELE